MFMSGVFFVRCQVSIYQGLMTMIDASSASDVASLVFLARMIFLPPKPACNTAAALRLLANQNGETVRRHSDSTT